MCHFLQRPRLNLPHSFATDAKTLGKLLKSLFFFVYTPGNDDFLLARAQARQCLPEQFFLEAHFLILGAILFSIGVVGIFLNRKNLIVLMMAIELMLLAVNMNFVAFSHYLGDLAGQVFVFFILTVAAAESAIGLAILVVLFRNLQTIHVDDLDSLKG